jgi:hypothetical protein
VEEDEDENERKTSMSGRWSTRKRTCSKDIDNQFAYIEIERPAIGRYLVTFRSLIKILELFTSRLICYLIE